MKYVYLFCASIFSFSAILHAAEPEKSDCLEKEKALALLETAEDFLSKAEDSYPSCNEDSNSTDDSGCGGKKPLVFIELSKKMISGVRKNFPKCTGQKEITQYVKHRDCSEILESGRLKSGVYTIWPGESNTNAKPLNVYCDMETVGGGWTVIQRRGKFPVQQDFNQDWETYKNGFGKITEEFWIGNENIRVLCHEGCEIRFDLTDRDGKKGFAVYRDFKVSESNYTLHISDYNGDAGDGMKTHNNKAFSTKDKGNTSFAISRHGGWWYSSGDYCQPNGLYEPGKSSNKNVYWFFWRKVDNLASVEMKVRPK